VFPGLIVLGHVGRPLEPHDLWRAWTFEPVTIALLALSAWMYATGLTRLWHAAGVGRGVRRPEAWSFAAGWLLLTLTLLSPLHALGGVLFSAHMAQHELLMTVAAPLLVMGRPLIPFVWALPPRWRRITGQWTSARSFALPWRALTHPATAFLIHAAAIWVWHLPSLYDATVTSEAMHAAQHASFLGTALLFWWVVVRPGLARGGTPASIGLLFGTLLHTGALGALLTLTSRLIYSAYAATTGPWGLTPLEDQQVGGLIMWVPGGLAYVIAALALVVRLFRESEQRAAWPEATRDAAAGVRQRPGLTFER
jgi:cytochrome c oxidase assembly factor CtaG